MISLTFYICTSYNDLIHVLHTDYNYYTLCLCQKDLSLHFILLPLRDCFGDYFLCMHYSLVLEMQYWAIWSLYFIPILPEEQDFMFVTPENVIIIFYVCNTWNNHNILCLHLKNDFYVLIFLLYFLHDLLVGIEQDAGWLEQHVFHLCRIQRFRCQHSVLIWWHPGTAWWSYC